MKAVDVGAVDDFDDGVIRVISVDSREIGVLRWHGEWYAFRNICPHLGAPVCVGVLHAFFTHDGGWEGGLVADDTRPVLMCPWHRWEFDLRQGHSLTGEERLRTYDVVTENGRVTVDMKRRA